MLPGCHSWDHSLPAEEVTLLTLVPWLYGKSWHGAGQPQETGQVNSLHFPCCARTPNSIPCFPQGFLPSAVGWGTPILQPQRLVCTRESPVVRQLACTVSSQPHRHCTSVAAGAYWRGEERSSCCSSIPKGFGGLCLH